VVLAAWALASALALATHYFAAFLVLPQALLLAARPELRRRALPALLAVLGTALALAPLAIHQRSLGLASFIAGESLPGRVAGTAKSFLVGFDSPLEVAVSVAAGLVAGAGVAAVVFRASGRERNGALIAAGLGVTAVAIPTLLAALGVDYLDTRNLLGAWLPLMLVPAAGLVSGRLGLAGLAALCVLGLVSLAGVALEPSWQRDDWRGMARVLGRPDGPRAIVVQPASGSRPLALYLRGLRPFPRGTARVHQIAVLHPVRRDVAGAHPAPPPRGLPPEVPSFQLAARHRTETFSVVLLEAGGDEPLALEQAVALMLRRDEPVAPLLQRP
jgi:mannosyltransferase